MRTCIHGQDMDTMVWGIGLPRGYGVGEHFIALICIFYLFLIYLPILNLLDSMLSLVSCIHSS
jgi:hypothetical protein